MVQENEREWKVHLNWAAGVKVQVRHCPATGQRDLAEPMVKESIARSDDLFTIGFKVEKPDYPAILVTRIVHRVEPNEMAPYLDLGRMRPVAAGACFFPAKSRPTIVPT